MFQVSDFKIGKFERHPLFRSEIQFRVFFLHLIFYKSACQIVTDFLPVTTGQIRQNKSNTL